MSPAISVAASLSPDIRQDIGIQVLSCSQPISQLAATHQVSRKFIYQQGDKAQQALDESFAPSHSDDEVLFHLPVTKNWLYQLILGLVLICHSLQCLLGAVESATQRTLRQILWRDASGQRSP